MSTMKEPAGWGPSHQTSRRKRGRPWWIQLPMLALLLVWLLTGASTALGVVVLVCVGFWVLIVIERKVKHAGVTAGDRAAAELAHAEDPLRAVREACWARGAGPYLGVDDRGEMRFARPERALLLVGPPRSGKTSGVIIPAVLANPFAAVCTSTKPDLATATAPARSRLGRVWSFDPTGRSAACGPRGVAVVADQLLTEMGRGAAHGPRDERAGRSRHHERVALGEPRPSVVGAVSACRSDRWSRCRVRSGLGDASRA
jgi:hypothetical protein